MTKIIEIPTTKFPFMIGETRVAKLVVSGLGFAKYAKVHVAAGKADDPTKALFRERIKAQVSAFDGAGKQLALTDIAVMMMPAPYAVQMKAALDAALWSQGEKAGEFKVLSAGDGVLTPIHVQLGKPITGDNVTTGMGTAISEIEFIARTLSDLEDVLVADGNLDAAMAAFAMGKPVGADVNLLAMPSWAVDQLSISDGVGIIDHVVKVFLAPSASA